jgi:2-keto-4-pentenoate hydratase/2-oxohepta-3-ene-1,7-dioic acid hydratase in catechol pathway
MRLVTYRDGETVSAGVLIDDEILPAAAAAQAGLDIQSSSVRALLESLEPDELTRLGEAASSIDRRLSRDSVTLLPPVPDPQKIICLGLNYRDHAAESGQEVPQQPLWFGKFANSLIGDGAPVLLPAAHPDYVDHEAELAVVIGSPAHNVSAEGALGYIAGAMPFNDVSARDLQLQNQLWTSGKAIDSFAPCGPALVTLDEIGDLQGLALRSRINGELLQEGTTSEMIFGIAETIAWLSRTMTLLPGDIVATGTPAGVGATKGKFLRDGDTVSVEVEGLGMLTNPVVSPESVR